MVSCRLANQYYTTLLHCQSAKEGMVSEIQLAPVVSVAPKVGAVSFEIGASVLA